LKVQILNLKTSDPVYCGS